MGGIVTTKDTTLKFRVGTDEKHGWERVAGEQGIKLSEFLRRSANEAVQLHDSLSGDAEQQRAERRLVKRAMYPQQTSLEKKTYKPDFK
jgi:hypothetical protein